VFQLYSKGCEYAIKALIQMRDPDQNYSAKQICKRARIPESFSRKIFQALVRGGFLEAIQGPGGGYCLRQHPKKISVLDIVRAVEGNQTFNQCVMGLSRCVERNPCALHDSWLKAKEKLTSELREKRLQDLIDTYDDRNEHGKSKKSAEKEKKT